MASKKKPQEPASGLPSCCILCVERSPEAVMQGKALGNELKMLGQLLYRQGYGYKVMCFSNSLIAKEALNREYTTSFSEARERFERPIPAHLRVDTDQLLGNIRRELDGIGIIVVLHDESGRIPRHRWFELVIEYARFDHKTIRSYNYPESRLDIYDHTPHS